MSKPKYTFIAAAIRDYYYKDFYDSVAVNNKIPFEIIFVGPNPPLEKMPDNFHYIKTHVKPGQCYEIAARAAKGEYLHTPGDDFTFSKNYLNNLYKYIKMLDMDKVFITVRNCHPDGKSEVNKKHIDHGFVFDAMILNASYCGCAPVFRADLWHKLGGYDKRFYGAYPDMDLQQRFYEYGMRPFLTPDCILSEHNFYHIEDHSESMSVRCGTEDGEILRSFWIKEDGTISKNRLLPVQSYDDKDILIKDQ